MELTINIEPTWEEIINVWIRLDLKVKNDNVLPELRKMAKLCDAVRQAEKKGKVLLIKEGKISEVIEDE